MEAAVEVSLMYRDLIQNQIRFIEHMTGKLRAINSKQEKMAQEIQGRFVLNQNLTEESDDDVKIKKSDFEKSSEEEKLQMKQMEQKNEEVRRTEEMEISKAGGMETVKELRSSLSVHDEERAKLQYLHQKYRRFPQKASNAEKERDDADMERKMTALSSGREEKLLQEIEELKEKLKVANKALKEREKKEKERESHRQRERQREEQKLKELEEEFLEREMKMKMEFAEREKVWAKERERLQKRELTNIKRENWMEDRVRRLQKELVELRRRSGLRKDEEKQLKKRRS
ncbi:golgin subfamily A member 6-like protein 1 [Pygocentrus nattereri]|uniref:golgin subfamily A member 6-like protein 1 n=1 Tax=Pygocentrus nattereri TaxID=42514 RepID=UPI000814845B|nr:golgin subfamily A member 6-like protein 1 [Pygocentrus nattereri]XP_017572873.1 golgin subfamily A member 6-like protein 1 [Pygocentrus nattereri]XP_017572874.1 golgin subfamily A member 6-like protein 1 [Pygocentrus nattereri]